MKKKFHTIIIILLIFFLYLIISHLFNLFPLENLENPSKNPADSESNTLIHSSSNRVNEKQYIVDRMNNTFTENDNNTLVRSQMRTTTPLPITQSNYSNINIVLKPPPSPAITVQDNINNNLNFNNGLEYWDTKYFPESIIGPNGVGLQPSISIKNGKDSYGFTFTKNYVQLEFTNIDQYVFTPYDDGDPRNIIPFVYLQAYLRLDPGTYQLKYNIQTRPNISWDIDSRSVGIMSMVNETKSPLFKFYTMDKNKKKTPFLTDETQITPQTLNFTVSKDESLHPITFSFIFVVTTPSDTNNCTVAFGDIQILNCAHNACTNT